MFGKKKQNYATAKLIKRTKTPDLPEVRPLKGKKVTYIKYLNRLKDSIRSKNDKMQRFLQIKYFPSQGIVAPTTEKACTRMIREIENWP